METSDRLAERSLICEEIIKKYMPEPEGYAATVIEAMNYGIMSGGKRLRPVLVLETCKLFGGAPKELLEPFAAAIEMIHNYSLIHDDLPAMDDDELRRGRRTTHKVYGEAMGILAGDGLLNLAFETAAGALTCGAYADRAARAMQVLARKPGYSGMLGGQTVDIEAGECVQEITLDLIRSMYEWKTSALIECSMMMGAILAGADEKDVAEVEQIASLVGLAFQIRDDVLDVEGDQEVLGKPIGSDEKNEKNTYLSFVGLEAAKEKTEELSKEAIERMKKLEQAHPSYDGFLSELFEFLVNRDK